MKTKKHFLKTIAKGIAWFAGIAVILAAGATLAVLIAFQASRTPGLVLGGIACLALLYFGVRAAVKAIKKRGVVERLSKTMAKPKLDNDRMIPNPMAERLAVK